MHRPIIVFILFLSSIRFFGQETILPDDFRQHSLTQFNASLLNPTFALDWNNPKSLSVWSRWQWQTIDGDPTTFFANYTHGLNTESVLGIGLIQHNTGTFLNTGGVLNFAQSITVKDNINLIVGANVSLFNQEIATNGFNTGSDAFTDQNDFLAQFSPGIRLKINQFNIALSLDNVIGYNFTQNENNTENSVFSGVLSNDFSIGSASSGTSFIRPVLYVKTSPSFETQYGGNLLINASKFWLQGGYNSFYGPSGGLGVTFFKKLSIGGLVEFATNDEISDEDLTFELIASYHFGKVKERKKEEEPEEEDEISEKDEAAEKEKAKQAEMLEQEELRKKQLEQEQDSISRLRARDSILIVEKRRLDSIDTVEQNRKKKETPNEKYEEVSSASVEGLSPGFYMIANVFGTKKYFNAFMKSTAARGLNPKSFYRTANAYNYVYLAKYDTFKEATNARDTKLGGRYSGKVWILRVK